MVHTKSRTAGRHRRLNTGKIHGHHIGIALNHHHMARFENALPRLVDTKENLILVVQLRVRRVDVLGFNLVLVVQLARTETQRPASNIANRPGQTSAEIVVHAVIALASDTGIHHFLVGKALGSQVAHQIVPAERRITAAKLLTLSLGKVASGEQLAGWQGFVAEKIISKEFLRLLAHLQQARTWRA